MKSKLVRGGIGMCLCILRAPVECCWSWWKGEATAGHGHSRINRNSSNIPMLLLAVDTSGREGSIALARGNPDGSCDVIEVVPLAGGTFSAQLVPQIAALLFQTQLQQTGYWWFRRDFWSGVVYRIAGGVGGS